MVSSALGRKKMEIRDGADFGIDPFLIDDWPSLESTFLVGSTMIY